MRLVLVAAFLLASGGSVAATPCPSGKALLDVARAAFPPELRNPTGAPAHTACGVVRAHGTHWLITTDTDGLGLVVALMSGKDVDWRCCQLVPGTPNVAIDHVRIADLDGDGVDELLVTASYTGHERFHRQTLFVHSPTLALEGREDGIELARSSPYDGWDCASTWKLVPGPHGTQLLEVAGTCTGSAPNDYPTGRHIYTVRHGEIVELTSP